MLGWNLDPAIYSSSPSLAVSKEIISIVFSLQWQNNCQKLSFI